MLHSSAAFFGCAATHFASCLGLELLAAAIFGCAAAHAASCFMVAVLLAAGVVALLAVGFFGAAVALFLLFCCAAAAFGCALARSSAAFLG